MQVKKRTPLKVSTGLIGFEVISAPILQNSPGMSNVPTKPKSALTTRPLLTSTPSAPRSTARSQSTQSTSTSKRDLSKSSSAPRLLQFANETCMPAEPAVLTACSVEDVPSSPSSDDEFNSRRFSRRFNSKQHPRSKPATKVSAQVVPVPLTENLIGPWSRQPLEMGPSCNQLSLSTTPFTVNYNPRLNEVLIAFCALHKVPLPTMNPAEASKWKSVSDELPEDCDQSRTSPVGVFNNWIFLRPSYRDGKGPHSIWVRGNRVYDLQNDRGTVEDFIKDCFNASTLDINRSEVRMRRQGLLPFPYLPLPAPVPVDSTGSTGLARR